MIKGIGNLLVGNVLAKTKVIREGGKKGDKEFEPDDESYGEESIDEASDSASQKSEEMSEFFKDADIDQLRMEIALTLIAEEILKETIGVNDISDLMARYLLRLKIKEHSDEIDNLNS